MIEIEYRFNDKKIPDHELEMFARLLLEKMQEQIDEGKPKSKAKKK